MNGKETVYKLYYVAESKPTKGLFLKPYVLSLDSVICTLGAHFMLPEIEQLTNIGVGMCVGLFATGCYNLRKYKKLKKVYHEYNQRFEVFLEEAKKIIGSDATIGIDDIVMNFSVRISSSFQNNQIMFKDNSCICEVFGTDYYICDYYRDAESENFEDEKIDLTSAVKAAYSINMNKKEKNSK